MSKNTDTSLKVGELLRNEKREKNLRQRRQLLNGIKWCPTELDNNRRTN
jgi:hypothetical protein